jgi:hypothetical protein
LALSASSVFPDVERAARKRAIAWAIAHNGLSGFRRIERARSETDELSIKQSGYFVFCCQPIFRVVTGLKSASCGFEVRGSGDSLTAIIIRDRWQNTKPKRIEVMRWPRR